MSGLGRITTAQQQMNDTMRKPTANRPIGTANRDMNFQSVGLSTNIKFADRPVTHHGIKGIGLNFQGPGRQIQDRSFYFNILRQKTNEIAQEVTKMRQQMDEIHKDNNIFFNLEKKYDEVSREVRILEGTLADYNLTLDKQRSNTRPEDLKNLCENIKIMNQRTRAQIDDIFIEKKEQEDQINHIENEILQLAQEAELKLNELDPEQRTEYEQLIRENKDLNIHINTLRNEMEEITTLVAQTESKLRMDSNKLRAQQLREEISVFERKKEDLEMQLNENKLSFPEARDRLLERVKEDNALIVTTDKKIKDKKKLAENYERRLRQIQSDMEEKKVEEVDKQKYAILHQREQEMSEFILTFDTERKRLLNHLKDLENGIVQSLEESSRILQTSGNLPSYEEYQELKKDLGFKATQNDANKNTVSSLQAQLEKRSSELKRLENAEERVEKELNAYNEKIVNMKKEINEKFDNVPKIREENERKKQTLIREKEELKKYREKIAEALRTAIYEHDLKDKKFTMHDSYAMYTDFEKRYIQNEQQLYQMKTYISTKTKDVNYQELQKACLGLLGTLGNAMEGKKY